MALSSRPLIRLLLHTWKEAHVSDYLHANFIASQRRILFTKWIGQGWEEVSAKKDMVVRGFKKCGICGISVAIDGSEDNEIHIKDLEGYKVESDDDDDPFVSKNDCSSDTCSSNDSSNGENLMIMMMSSFSL